VAQGTLPELCALSPQGAWYLVEAAGLDAPRIGALPEVDLVEPLGIDGAFRSFRVFARADPRVAIAELARAGNHPLRTLDHRLPTLEEAFVAIVGRE
jgi:hypothetical protein